MTKKMTKSKETSSDILYDSLTALHFMLINNNPSISEAILNIPDVQELVNGLVIISPELVKEKLLLSESFDLGFRKCIKRPPRNPCPCPPIGGAIKSIFIAISLPFFMTNYPKYYLEQISFVECMPHEWKIPARDLKIKNDIRLTGLSIRNAHLLEQGGICRNGISEGDFILFEEAADADCSKPHLLHFEVFEGKNLISEVEQLIYLR